MEVQRRVCCGLDVHRDTVTACLLRADEPAERRKQVRTFAADTAGLTALAEWLAAAGCEDVAMEATGVYWKPVFNVSESVARVVVANAAHIKGLPGRKTDVQDAEWIADLFQHGLVRPSFIPERFWRELPGTRVRVLTRTRTTLIDERSAVVNRLHKVLQDANLKLSSVATDVLGVSGRALLAAILAGQSDPAALAHLAKGRLRQKREALERALTGHVTAQHRALLALHLAHLDFLDDQIAQLSARIAEALRPFDADLAHPEGARPGLARPGPDLDSILGVGRTTAAILLAELGTEMARFPTAAQAASWGRLRPGNRVSAGKRQGGKARKGSVWLRRALVEAASAAIHNRRSDLYAQYRRIAARGGCQKAVLAVAHTLLRLAYHVLKTHEDYREQERAALDERRRAARAQRAVAQLTALGYDVALTPKQPAA